MVVASVVEGTVSVVVFVVVLVAIVVVVDGTSVVVINTFVVVDGVVAGVVVDTVVVLLAVGSVTLMELVLCLVVDLRVLELEGTLAVVETLANESALVVELALEADGVLLGFLSLFRLRSLKSF